MKHHRISLWNVPPRRSLRTHIQPSSVPTMFIPSGTVSRLYLHIHRNIAVECFPTTFTRKRVSVRFGYHANLPGGWEDMHAFSNRAGTSKKRRVPESGRDVRITQVARTIRASSIASSTASNVILASLPLRHPEGWHHPSTTSNSSASKSIKSSSSSS